ncbi:Coenzyme F420 hydrogenase subunit beta [Methanosarcina siciliae C2J]|uniref:Coenzyme F420 hydrogenase subunit beta n=3 Tax=Methanosarcina siciliae TaxID=38027 RepID=A0A0E3PIP4_9EURY|nr:Coenzyme F420 hydrogenase/dehydrogenase, beta subunit C-terminal domain [Methanosarcina siciliae]AKB30183.1 Coenzyme F420 hydrogenase subunit beta [Methanosarcina siciliae T4/M]AKB34084.1 Coenzyme F420 hydrogenase subunit beta [Methanosarcina siciliae HI350]AKB38453.1 Coenzyme F420 hydrogenase subunit beta [Methanosarcina siciliae C2J]
MAENKPISKSYIDLKSKVWDTGLCSGCGACVAVCPADSLYFETGGESTYPKSNNYCKAAVDDVPCGACYEICPRLDEQSSSLLGDYLEITTGKAEFDVPRKQSGGAVTAILANALDTGLVDAVVTVTDDPWTLKPRSMVITSSEVLVGQAGSRYNWWVPLVSSLKEAVVKRKYRNVAVVGVPCVVQAVRKMLESDHQLISPYKKSIRIIIGLFCTESFDYEKLIAGKLKSEYALEPMKVCRIDVKGKLEITLNDGTQYVIPLTELEDTVRPGCAVCTDFTALKADISAGAVGSPNGYTTLIVRTLVGQHLLESAVANGKLSIGGGSELNLGIIEKLATKKLERKPE